MPVPDRDFDTTEVAVPWRLLTDGGHSVTFATEGGGTAPRCDPRLLTGVPFGKLGAEPEARACYRQLTEAPDFRRPVSWRALDPADYDGLLLPGGHAPGMRQYLGSAALQEQVARFWALGRPVGAICHGVLVLARTRDPATGRSVLADRRTTCLPKSMERTAYYATAWRLGRYYRTTRRMCRTRSRPHRLPRTGSSRARDRSHGARRPTTRTPSSCRTATTSRPAGPGTPTSSPNGSTPC
ncbi:MAG: hypothetical protein QOI83_3952 [Streptomycetaceae bacterium]|nr:hypothetical protein [Streptomycetaceae bacterium]